jgi:adenylosuccinate synthase
VICVLPAGSYIRPDILFDEIGIAGLDPSRVLIDPNAVIITERELAAEQASKLGSAIGSTQSGTGAAVLARIRRAGEVKFAREVDSLQGLVGPVTPFLRDRLNKKQRVLVEGTQGFGLSVLHTAHYPYATSRDTTAAGFISEAGLSPLDVDDVVMVIRAFPIRVPGNSGPLPQEVSWSDITRESKSRISLTEFTSVTQKERRIARFDPEIVRQAIVHNQPTRIVLNHIDYLDFACVDQDRLTSKAIDFVESVEKSIGRSIDYVGFSRVKITALSAKQK